MHLSQQEPAMRIRPSHSRMTKIEAAAKSKEQGHATFPGCSRPLKVECPTFVLGYYQRNDRGNSQIVLEFGQAIAHHIFQSIDVDAMSSLAGLCRSHCFLGLSRCKQVSRPGSHLGNDRRRLLAALRLRFAAKVYDRNAAVNYANANWNKVVSDGYFWINGSTATYYGAGQPVPVNVPNEAGGIGDDCSHFVSSAIGSPPVLLPAV